MSKVKKKFFVYLLLCADNTFYCGSTDNLKKRLHAHNNLKSGAKYTRGRRPVTLYYYEEFTTYAEARKREGEVKKMRRGEKRKFRAPNQDKT